MTPRKVRRLRALVTLWGIAMAAAIVLQGGIKGLPGSTMRGVSGEELVADAIICAVAVFSLAQINQHVFSRMRRAPLYVVAPVGALLYLVVILGSSLLTIMLLVGVVTRQPEQVWRVIGRSLEWGPQVVAYPFAIAVAVSFLFELSRRVGPAKLINWLLGRYRNPREEQRVFLLIDVRGSTPLAEKMGALQFSFLIRDIFDDLTDPVLDTGGEVVDYVGDEAIISWRLKHGTEGASALQCFALFKAAIAARSAWYSKRYDLLPTFRAAIHAGTVVATEVGQLRTEVTFHGDALNTAARVLGECSTLESEVLLTRTISDRLGPFEGATFEPLGEFSLRGKGEPLALVRVTIP